MRVNRTLSGLLAIGMLFFMGTIVDAQRASREALTKSPSASGPALKAPPVVTNKSDAEDNAADGSKAISGSWIETVTFNSSMPPIRSMATFADDGTLIVADQGAVGPDSAFSPGHGSWVHMHHRTFACSIVELIYSTVDGSLIGYLKVSNRYTVTGNGNTYTGTFFATVTDPDGNILFTVDGTNAGTRIPLEILP